MKTPYVIVLAAFSLTSLNCTADEVETCGYSMPTSVHNCFYTGIGIGVSKLEPETSNTGWKTQKNSAISGNVYIGYQFLPSWFAELSYADLGKLTLRNINPRVKTDGNLRYQVVDVMTGYYLPWPHDIMPAPIRPFVKAGVAKVETNTSSSFIKLTQEHEFQFSWGLGLDWEPSRSWKVRNTFDFFDNDVKQVSLSIAYVFGGNTTKRATDREQAKTANQREMTKASCEKLAMNINNIMFEMNSSALTDQSILQLTSVSEAMRDVPEINITIHSFTDSEGNIVLSRKRSENIKGYLINHRIEARRLTTVSHGSENPIADNETISGKLKNRRTAITVDLPNPCESDDK